MKLTIILLLIAVVLSIVVEYYRLGTILSLVGIIAVIYFIYKELSPLEQDYTNYE